MIKHDEHLLQIKIVKYLTEHGVPCFSVPNHLLKTGMAEAKREIAGGLRKGAPDLIVGRDGKCYWLELKTTVGRQSEEQKAFQALAPVFGATYIVVRSLDDIKGIV